MSEEARRDPDEILSLPTIQKQLKYQDPTREHLCREFIADIRRFVKASIASSRTLGDVDGGFRSFKVQTVLNNLSNAYLDKHKNGEHYWPKESNSPYFNADLKYGSNRVTIRNLIKQLFYRLIFSKSERSRHMTPRLRHIRIDESRNQGNRRASLESRGKTSEDAISLGSSSASSSPRDTAPMSPGREADEANTSHASESSHTVRSEQGNPPLDQSMWEVPDLTPAGSPSPTRQGPHGSSNGAKKPSKPVTKARKSAKTSSNATQAKVTKNAGSVGSRKRNTPRDKLRARNPDAASDEQIEEATRSPTREVTAHTARPKPRKSKNRAKSCIQVAGVSNQASHAPVSLSLEETLFPAPPRADDASERERQAAADLHQGASSPHDPPVSNGAAAAASELDANSRSIVRPMVSEQLNPPLQYGVFQLPQAVVDAYAARAQSGDFPIPEQFIQLKPDDTEARGFIPVVATADGLVPVQVEYTTNPQQVVGHGMPQTTTQSAESNVQLTFVLILARAPLFKSVEWKPHGKFLSKSFAQLQAELPRELKEGGRGLLFRLSGNGVDTEQPVKFGRDGQFDVLKRFFKRQIQSARAQNKGVRMLPFEIEIESLVEGVTRLDVDEDDDLF